MTRLQIGDRCRIVLDKARLTGRAGENAGKEGIVTKHQAVEDYYVRLDGGAYDGDDDVYCYNHEVEALDNNLTPTESDELWKQVKAILTL